MSDKLVDRLRGQYEVGEGAMYGKRDFSDFIPAISLEAADRIEMLEHVLQDCASKLESQVSRNSNLPLSYRALVNRAFNVLRNEKQSCNTLN